MSAFSIGYSRPRSAAGYILQSRSPIDAGNPSTLAASRIPCLPLIVWNVTICATWSDPYFWATYRITSSRRRSSKSMSMSGICLRSGFRNRSKISPYRSGSRSVIRSAYDTTLPAALPRPGPTRIPRSRANRIRSHTIRKYPANPIGTMTSSSSSIRERISGVIVPYRAAAPSSTSSRR